MATAKSTTLSLRIDPRIKEGLRVVADKERRSLANMVEVMIREYCDKHNVRIPAQQHSSSD